MSKFMDDFEREYERIFNGRNRRTNTQSQSGATNQSDSSTGRANTQTAYQRAYNALFASQSAGKGASVMVPLSKQDAATIYQDYMNSIFYGEITNRGMGRTPSGKWCVPWMSGELGEPNHARSWEPHPVTHMQSEGIVAGEILAHRAWYWDSERKRLRSLFVDYEWPFTRPAKGQPARGYGIHAFKSESRASKEYSLCKQDLLFGTVALWGDIIEFEQGYCAEFARVESLIDAPAMVRELYMVKEK